MTWVIMDVKVDSLTLSLQSHCENHLFWQIFINDIYFPFYNNTINLTFYSYF